MSHPGLSLIVAASENDLIGIDGQLPWHLSSDLKRFRQLTTGHHIIMGRKTFESIGRLLPDRTTVIVSRNPDYNFPGAKIAQDIEAAVRYASGDDKPFIVGGAEIYRQSLHLVQTIYLTRVHTELPGNIFLPEIDWSNWQCVANSRFPADRKNQYEHSFLVYVRKRN